MDESSRQEVPMPEATTAPEESGADVLSVALLVFFVSLALVVAAMMILPAIL